jgi:hypothetical protein
MKNFILFTAALALVACGGSKPAPAAPAEPPAAPPAEPVASKPEPPPEPPAPPPPPPKVMKASADLTPIKGQKFKAATVKFSQKDGESSAEVASTAAFDGLKPGKYHLVVHTSAECGANAAKVGKPFAATANAAMDFTAEKDAANIDLSGVVVMVEGDQTITGHTLVLHDDKGGKPGKALACGPIVTLDSAD